MKKNIFIVLLSILLFSVSIPAHAEAIRNGRIAYEPSTRNGASMPPVSEQQLKAQIQFFQQALDKLGATSPEQAAKIWAEGPKTRNGVLQYSVACDMLKAKIIKKLGKPEDSFWNIGVSSPWVDKYEIGHFKKVNPSEYQTTIKYYWATSTGSAGTTQETLTITQKGYVWCVREVK